MTFYPQIFRQVLLKLSGESSNDPNGRLGEYLPLDLIEQTTCYLMKSCIVLKKPTQLSLLWSPFLVSKYCVFIVKILFLHVCLYMDIYPSIYCNCYQF